MDCYHIEGGVPLRGEYRVKGAKNSALPILAAAVSKPGIHEIHDCPRIGDVFVMEEILRSLGADTCFEGNCLRADTRNMEGTVVSREIMSRMRSSVFLMGSLLARHGEATVHRPGGCRIGRRPIDIHIDGLSQMGFCVESRGEEIRCSGRCRGGRVRLPYPSVGATENLMMAALSGENETVIENCACEPEIADLQGFLRTCGFDVTGGGTSRIVVRGFSKGTHASGGAAAGDTMYFIVEDRIEAATYMAAVLATGGRAVFRNIRTEMLEEVLSVFKRMGAAIRSFDDTIEIIAPEKLKSPGIVVTSPFPGFPTDCQPQLMTLCTAAGGLTTIREEVFESRFTHKKELAKMGANIDICGKNAIIKGGLPLKGAEVSAADLRGGAALVIAGLSAGGETDVRDIYHIDRGYENFDEGLRQMGGIIERRTCD